MKSIGIVLVLAALLPVVGSGQAADKLRVVATTPDLAAIARAVGGDFVDVTSIARPNEDPHFVDARPSFIRVLNQADVLIEGGAQLEAGWLPPLVEGARNSRIAVGSPGRVVASEGIALLDVPAQLNRAMGDVHALGNPHYLLDPLNAKTVAATIVTGLCVSDSTHCASYQDGARKFSADIDARLIVWQALLEPVRGTKVVTYHRDFDYFAQRFGLDVVDTLEPKPGIPPSPTHLVELIPKMQSDHVRLIIVEPNRERQNPDFVSEKTGARVLLLPIMPGGEQAVEYIELIDYNVRQVAAALKTT
ncbi:MAG: zinc ABC transporter substrate-binding protein [Deltaproteobacteria bacterium]|nr:zinc ABC transporter substrate-binding protein [Deltaproteobacteria bacterium]MBI3391094.1 zinc ABC transporter substrate-binding protein [Deltaproteobacteria bacterium]